MNTKTLPFLKNIGVMLTYKCTTACPHCIVRAGPNRTEEVVAEDTLAWIEEAASYRTGYIKGLALTGGEPFFNLDLLRNVSNSGYQHGMVVSVVSNAFWAGSKRKAVRVLSSLPGLSLVSLSTDSYHQQKIPIEFVINGISAAKECGLPYSIAVTTDHFTRLEFQKTLNRLKKIVDEAKIRISITFPVGRAEHLLHKMDYETEIQPSPAACTMGSSPVIFPDGNIFACIGPILTLKNKHPLFLGNIYEEPLKVILDRAESNIILHAIRLWGPGKLVEILQKKGVGKLLPDSYIADCICDACYKLMSNERIIHCLNELHQDIDFVEKVAYGRAYYLQENTMVQKFMDEEILSVT